MSIFNTVNFVVCSVAITFVSKLFTGGTSWFSTLLSIEAWWKGSSDGRCSLFLLLFSLLTVSGVRADELFLQRWAILSDATIQSTGLPELLTTELSQLEHLVLVERDQLTAVTRELEISQAFRTALPKQRLNLGKLLNANALLFLQSVEGPQKSHLKLTIAECAFGARISMESITWDPGELDFAEKIPQIVATVLRTRRQFPQGIRHLVAVPPFVSGDLLHDHDHLQTGFATMLQDSILRYPGTAVVELEEASAIAAEFERGGSLSTQDIPRTFVRAKYQTANGAVRQNNQSTKFKVDFTLIDADGAERHLSLNGSTAELVSAIRSSVVEEIVSGIGQSSQAVVPKAEAKSFLARRAAVFSLIGSFKESSNLREAALLLTPDDADLRMSLVADMRLMMISLRRDEAGRPRNGTRDEQLRLFRRTAKHVEILISQEALSVQDAGGIVSFMCAMLRHGCQPGSAEVQETMGRFFWNVAPKISALKTTVSSNVIRAEIHRGHGYPVRISDQPVEDQSPSYVADLDQQQNDWMRRAIRVVLGIKPYANSWLDPKQGGSQTPREEKTTLDDLFRVLTELSPSARPSSHVLQALQALDKGQIVFDIRRGRFQPDQFANFYRRLRATKRADALLYADVGDLALCTLLSYQKTDDPPDVLLARIQQALKQWEGDYRATQQCQRVLKPLFAEMAVVSGTERLGNGKSRGFTPTVDSFRAGSVSRTLICPLPPRQPAYRVRFEPLDGPIPTWEHLIQVNATTDVVWSRNAVHVMRSRNEIDLLFSVEGWEEAATRSEIRTNLEQENWYFDTKKSRIHHVVCDGRYVWIVTTNDGIEVVSIDGSKRHQINNEHELPPYLQSNQATQSSIMLHSVEEGKCFAIGKYGREKRLWFAMLTLPVSQTESDRPAKIVNVFHTATRRSTGQRDTDSAFTIFRPSWAITLPNDSDRKELLVNREALRPLRINLATLQTSVFEPQLNGTQLPGTNSHGNWRKPVFAHNQFLVAVHDELNVIDLPDSNSSSWASRKIYNVPRFGEKDGRKFSIRERFPLLNSLLQIGDTAWSPGPNWLQIILATQTVRKLTDIPLPIRHRYEHYAVSAHDGMVAWNRGDQTYRVHVNAADQKATAEAEWPGDINSRFSFVTSSLRGKHAAAIKSLEQLGARTDAVWSRNANSDIDASMWQRKPGRVDKRWATIVWLDENWQGADEDLKLFGDLQGPFVVFLRHAPIGNAGIRHLAANTVRAHAKNESTDGNGLLALFLEGTKVNDTGIQALEKLSSLRVLHLDSQDDPERLTDVGVKSLRHLRLCRLTLIGHGFTDASMQALTRTKTLRMLELARTSITPEGWQTLRSHVRTTIQNKY